MTFSTQNASHAPSNNPTTHLKHFSHTYIHLTSTTKSTKSQKNGVSVQNCTKCSAELSKRAVGGSKFDFFYSNLATHTPHTLYNMFKTLFSYSHYCKKHWKVEKIGKTVFFCSKTALSALQSTQNEPLEGQNLKSSSQKASNTPSNHSYNTFETLFSYIHTPGKHRKVDKITKKRVFCAKLH